MQALALDLGGSHVSCALMLDQTCVVRQDRTLATDSFAHTLPVLEALLHDVLEQAAVRPTDCAGIALGFPGIADTRTGKVTATNAKFDDALHIDLPAWAMDRFGIPLVLENDARLALRGEHFCGAASGAMDAVFVTLGTGIGVAAMLDGRPLQGRQPQTGCLGGHLPVVVQGRRCTCGNLGCAEAEASTWALPEICRGWPGFTSSRLARAPALHFAALFAAADCGDTLAQAVLRRCLDVWSTLAVALIHAYSPEILVFGGGVMARSDDILPPIRQFVAQHAWSPQGEVAIRASVLGSAPALYGAVPLLQETLPRETLPQETLS